MARPPSVSDHQLIQTFREHQDYAKTAESVGLHRTTVHRRLQKLKVNGAKVSVMEHAGTLVQHGIDAFAQVIDINKTARALLDTLLTEDELCRNGAKCPECAAEVPRVLFSSDGTRKLMVKVMAEIRGQLKTQLEYANCLYDLKANAEFQRAVIDSIGEVSPEVKRAILDKLQGERAIRASVQFQ